jgi:hypothetical protein
MTLDRRTTFMLKDPAFPTTLSRAAAQAVDALAVGIS